MPPGLFDNTPKTKLKQEPTQAPVVNNRSTPHLAPNQGEIISKYLNKQPPSNPTPIKESPSPPPAPVAVKANEPKAAPIPANNLQQVVNTTLNHIAAPNPIVQKKIDQPAAKSVQPKDPKEMTVEELQQIVLKKEISSSKNTGTSSYKGVVLVTLQMVAIFIIIFGFVPPYLFTDSTLLMIGGIFAIIVGLFVGAWAIVSFRQKISIFPEPSDESLLIVDGPYRFVRNPMYTSLLLISCGVVMVYPTLIKVAGLGMLLAVLFIKSGYERKLLTQRFSGYGKYASKTGRFLPKISTLIQRL